MISGGQEEPPTARIEPRFLTVNVGESVEFVCLATGTPSPKIMWSGGQGGILSGDVEVEDGVLRIASVRRIHQSEYYCDVESSAGSAKVRTILYVEGGQSVTTSSIPA